MEIKQAPKDVQKKLCEYAKHELEITGYKDNVPQLSILKKKVKVVKMDAQTAQTLNSQMRNTLRAYEYIAIVLTKEEKEAKAASKKTKEDK